MEADIIYSKLAGNRRELGEQMEKDAINRMSSGFYQATHSQAKSHVGERLDFEQFLISISMIGSRSFPTLPLDKAIGIIVLFNCI